MAEPRPQRGRDGLFPSGPRTWTRRQRQMILDRDNNQCQAKVRGIKHECTEGIVSLEIDHTFRAHGWAAQVDGWGHARARLS